MNVWRNKRVGRGLCQARGLRSHYLHMQLMPLFIPYRALPVRAYAGKQVQEHKNERQAEGHSRYFTLRSEGERCKRKEARKKGKGTGERDPIRRDLFSLIVVLRYLILLPHDPNKEKMKCKIQKKKVNSQLSQPPPMILSVP